jgi:glycosyltransferase involved in cell wall biosynthesis
MPSVTEGLSLTPMEATLCGCPSVLCDGAIGDLYFDEQDCLVAKKDDIEDLYKKCKKILKNDFSDTFKRYLSDIVKKFTWEKTINNILEVMS